MTLHKKTFNWRGLRGSREALKWNCRDLTSIDAVLAHVPKRKCCVQAGGNLGVFAKYLAKFFPSVWTFEPAPPLFPMLVANVPEENVVRMQVALGERAGVCGTICARRGRKDAPVHEGLTHIGGSGIVPMLPLDAFDLQTLDLLYLDLEGFELFALRGAEQTIARCRPVVSIEVNQNSGFYGIERDTVRAFLLERRYRFVARIMSDELFVPIPVES